MSVPGEAMGHGETARAETPEEIICPMCLSALDLDSPVLWRWDLLSAGYVELHVPADATGPQRAHLERGAMIKCPDPAGFLGEHYLPAEYVRFGRPVVIGFIGVTTSGKTHLLSAMLGAIEGRGLADFRISSRPLDQAWHHRFMAKNVQPLLEEHKVLDRTEEDVISFADAFLMGPAGGPERAVAMFDVAGGELSREKTSVQGTKKFLEIADGLVFVADSGRLPEVSAAVVLNKADLRRFDDPVTRWLRTDIAGLDPELILRESADVFAYLELSGAKAWTQPCADCGKGTLHVVSATGGPGQQTDQGEFYPRGVTPRRVLGPLVALLAMTGVLADERARQVGV